MRRSRILRNLFILSITLWTVPLSAQEQRAIDSLRSMIDLEKATGTQKVHWLFQIAEVYYYSNQTSELNAVIQEVKAIIPDNDKCLRADLSVFEARYLSDVNHIPESKQKAREGLVLARKNKCRKAEVDLLLHLAGIFMSGTELDSCNFYCQRAKNVAEENHDRLLMAKVNRMLGLSAFMDHQFQASCELFQSSYKVFLQFGDDILAGKTVSDIADCYYSLSRYDSALVYATLAESILAKSASVYDLAVNYNLMALIYQSTGPMDEAIDAYFNGLRIADDYGIESLQLLFLYNLGNCYYELDALEKASERFRLCLTLAWQANDTSTVIYALSALGNLASEENQPDTAYSYLKRSYELAMLTHETGILSFLAASLADLKIREKDYGEAQKYTTKAYEYARITNSPEELISVHITQAMLYADTKRFNQSIALLLRVMEQSKQIQSIEGTRMSLESLAEVYEKKKDYKNALIYYQKVKEFEDSTKLTSTLEKFINTEVQFQKEKAERIRDLEIENANLDHQAKLRETRLIALIAIITTLAFLLISLFLYLLSKASKRRASVLEEKNRLIQSHSDELARMVSRLTTLTEELELSNKTKSKLFSIIGHDLKSPFNIIQGYSNLLLSDDPDKQTRELYYKRIAESSGQLVCMINTLLEWAMAQSGAIEFNPVVFDITSATNDLIATTRISADRKNITISQEYDTQEEFLITADKNMFERIMHNLVSNAIKYTPKNGEVTVGWDLRPNHIQFIIRDTGVGMPAGMAESIFENSMEFLRKGTDGEKGTGLGLSICKEFVKRHKGEIWAVTDAGKGSRFYFTLPVS